MEPFVLRRLKSTVLSEMEPKIEVVSKFPMSAIQAGFYNSLLKQARDRKRAAAGGKKSGPSASTVVDLTSDAEEEASASHLSDISSIKLSAGVVKHLYTDLRKAANHPVLLSRHYVADPEVSISHTRLL